MGVGVGPRFAEHERREDTGTAKREDALLGDGSNWYRINELERLSGISRRNVHFYLEQGLLHPPRRTGRTMAYYDDGHLAELDFIRRSRARGTPLFAIKEQLSSRLGRATAERATVARRTGKRTSADPAAAQHASPGRPAKGHASAGRVAAEPAAARHARENANNGSRIARLGSHSTKADGGNGARRAPARRGRPPGRGEMHTRILDVGCRLFLSKGFKATAVSDIIGELNVGKGTFYFHYSNKDELFLECAPRLFQGLFAASWDKIRREHDPVRRLQARAEAVLPVLDDFCAILAMSREALQSPHAKIRKMGRQVVDSICAPLAEDLRAGMAHGEIRPLDPVATSVMLIGVMESLQYLRGTGTKLMPAQMRDAVASSILFGIGSGPALRGESRR